MIRTPFPRHKADWPVKIAQALFPGLSFSDTCLFPD